ncbi:unnamed protein product [Adineta ricciae]|uniref:Uncharacterized protein n=1 Tax=Adineta ricciae TaxID=249248 RepID=A0A816BAQ7_ADIRI|nr:unnamed protein product [Adineta ricciae]CAF1606558.1 unnamed protein product [Adineta ricciae]
MDEIDKQMSVLHVQNNISKLNLADSTLNSLTQFYDDSSDEDDDVDGLSININDKVNSVKDIVENGSKNPSQVPVMQLLVCFINYSFGLALYNAAKVKSTYRSWKEKHLSRCSLPPENIIICSLQQVFKTAIEDRITIKQHANAFKKLAMSCQNQATVMQHRDKLLNYLGSNLRPVIRCISADTAFPDDLLRHLDAIDKEICKYLKDVEYSTVIEQDDLDPPLAITARSLSDEMTEHLENVHRAELSEMNRMRDILRRLNLFTLQRQHISIHQSKRETAQRNLHDLELSPFQQNYMDEVFRIQERLNFEEFNLRFKEIFFERQMQDLIDREKNRGEQSIIQGLYIRKDATFCTSEFREYEEYMDEFKSDTIESLSKLIDDTILTEAISFRQHFISLLNRTITEVFEQYIRRSSLPTMHIHKIRSTVDYIASLRLTRRSIYRTYRNQHLQQSIFGKSKEEHHDIGWQFPRIGDSYIAIERTRITANACSSLIQIETRANTYQKLGEKIQLFLSNQTAYLDCSFVLWIRQIINGDKNLEFKEPMLPKACHDMTLFLVQLAHLFVGAESIRYPAALVQAQMVMDLIQAGHLTWSNAFTAADNHIYYPMVLEKATRVCRTLASTFRRYSFYSHRYPGEQLEMDDIMVSKYLNAEYQLTTAWLKLQTTSFNELNDEQILSEVVDRAISRWYPGILVDK